MSKGKTENRKIHFHFSSRLKQTFIKKNSKSSSTLQSGKRVIYSTTKCTNLINRTRNARKLFFFLDKISGKPSNMQIRKQINNGRERLHTDNIQQAAKSRNNKRMVEANRNELQNETKNGKSNRLEERRIKLHERKGWRANCGRDRNEMKFV